MRLVSLLITLGLFSCATAQKLSPEGAKVKIQKNDPPNNCKELGAVKGDPGFGGDTETAKNDMRNQAAALGSNYVRWETVSEVYVTGTAYKCP